MKFNGTIVPSPDGIIPSILDISKADRNANGDVIIERINTKRKFELTWSFISDVDASFILQLVKGTLFEVEYKDMQENTNLVGTFYAGDRKAETAVIKNGTTYYKNLKFSIIER